MKPEEHEYSSMDDLIFENRNRDYGAYTNRRSYKHNITFSMGVNVAIMCALIIFIQTRPDKPVVKSTPKDLDGYVKLDERVIVEPLHRIEPPRPAVPVRHIASLIPVPTPDPVEEMEEQPTEEFTSGSENGDPNAQPTEGIIETIGTGDMSLPPDDNKEYIVVEKMPKLDNMFDFIRRKLRYPSRPQRLGIEGTVFVEFVVNKEGQVINVKVVKGIDADCDKEAVRVISMLPAWEPGIQNDNPVSVKMVLPIKFSLNKG